MTTPTAERVRELFSYCPATGEFIRLISTKGSRAGQKAGTLKSNGYLHFSVDGKKHGAHRIAWLHVYGYMPVGDVDHIDGDRQNNAINNLRDVDRSTNLENQRTAKSSNKSTGLLGAYFHKQIGRYTSRITTHGKDKHLGCFATAEEAHAAYIHAKRELHAGNTL